jgi:predicted AAA+ superfamily ATPase
MIVPSEYRPRVIDAELDELVPQLQALAIEGAKGVGKTATASRRAATIHALDDPAQRSIAHADAERLLDGPPPVLIDEWQRVPEVWDLVRRRVDAGASPGQFLLTGSASPKQAAETHSGAGRIVSIRMRPMSLSERSAEPATVSLAALLSGKRSVIAGRTSWRLDDYVDEILRSGLPGLRSLSGRALRAQLDGYLARIIDRDVREIGHPIRNPAALTRWMRAYAAASSTTTSFEKIRDAAMTNEGDKPSRAGTQPYRDALERLWILDPVPAWAPTRTRIRRLTLPDKHQLADPALAARLLGVDARALLSDGTLLGTLFESLVTLSAHVYAQHAEASLAHLRTGGGEHEVDLVVVRGDDRVVGIEVKLARDVGDHDVRHLHWLRSQVGDDLLDAVVVTTGPEAYRRSDGIAVVPASLLGP